NAIEETIRQSGFKIDRVDERLMLVTSRPRITSQFFEFWRPDVQTVKDSAEASLFTIRRTMRFEISKREDGQFECSPMVLVERQVSAEQRVTNVSLYRGSVSRINTRDRQNGTKESDDGVTIPTKYWYATGRDESMEKRIAAQVDQ